MANRPWRKLKLQVETAEKWISVGQEGQDVVDASLPQVGGHGAWDKDQAMQVCITFRIKYSSTHTSSKKIYVIIEQLRSG